MELTDNQILNHTQVLQKIRRIAFEIYENNFEETQIVIAGIKGQGYAFAKKLALALNEISNIEATAVLIDVDKDISYDSPVELFWLHTYDFMPKNTPISSSLSNTTDT